MDNNENATRTDGHYSTRFDTQHITGVVHLPDEGCIVCNEHRAELDTNDDLDHCPSCGFDCGTHRPKCPRSYGIGDYGNPNRPVAETYCYQCGYDQCLWTTYSQHYTDPQPLTLDRFEHLAIIDRIDAMTDSQRRDLCVWFSSSPLIERGIHFVTPR